MALNTFSSGVNTSFSTELNENFEIASLLADSMSADATEYSAAISSTAWQDVGFSKTFTPQTGTDAFLKAIKVDWDLKVSSGAAIYRIAITNNTTSTTFYAYRQTAADDSATNVPTLGYHNTSTYTSYTDVSPLLLSTANGASNDAVRYAGNEGQTGGATYTVTIEAQRSGASGTATAYVQNITMVMYYDSLVSSTRGWA